MAAPRLWYALRYLPDSWRYGLARALVWGGGYVSEGVIEASPHGGFRGYRVDPDGTKWYHQSWLSPTSEGPPTITT